MKETLLAVLLLLAAGLFAEQPSVLHLQTSTITSTPAVHSGAFGTYNHKWFFIGGRKNGLHGFLPPSAFPDNSVNDSIYIVDPAANQRWSASTYTLPDSIREAINSSNMEFYLSDTTLYMVGGYGWTDVVSEFITFHTLTAVNIKGLMDAMISAQPIADNFRQMKDSNLAVCGAHLQRMDSTYYLVFGHRYDGHYDRSDSTSAIAYQAYTCAVRKFQIADDGSHLAIYNYSAIQDSVNFRRRDYNLLPFLDPFRGEGLLAFSGVFKPLSRDPYLNCVEIYKDTIIVRNDFNQNLSQYHSATCAVYDSISLTQHNLFFGGLSMYYVDTLTQQTIHDSLVPFVRTISNVVRDMDGMFHELDAGIRMPALLGTNAYFFNDEAVPVYKNQYIHLNLVQPHQRLGYIVGGIESMDLNIAENSPDAQSYASTRVFEVYLDTVVTTTGLTEVSNEVLNYFCYPNPATDKATLEFELKKAEQVKIELLDLKGSLVQEVCNTGLNAGKQKLLLNLAAISKGVYNCVLTVNNHRKSIRLAKD